MRSNPQGHTSPLRWAVLAGLVALCSGAVLAAEPVWPQPAPGTATSDSRTSWWRPRQTLRTPPFQAPSATGCADTPAFTEVPGQQRQRGGMVLERAMYDRVPAAEAMAAAPAIPAPMPAPVVSASVAGKQADVVLRLPRPRPQPTQGPVTAGVVDDNADFGGFMQFMQRNPEAQGIGADVSVRQRVQVRDAAGRPVPDAEVAVSGGGARFWVRTDAGGQAWVFPNAFDQRDTHRYQVDVRSPAGTGRATLQRGQKQVLEVVLNGTRAPARAQLDLVFMVDATGSMSDEIDKLRSSLQDIVRQIGQLPSRPQVCLGLVTYRDTSDEYLLRSWNLTDNVQAFQQVLDKVRADGGGDYPEAMNPAFAHAVQKLSWRGQGTTRLLLTLADAPPHVDDATPHYPDTLHAAAGKGIKVLSVAASGQDRQGEAVQRQMAQYTGGRFIFLTYQDADNPASGAGTQTSHDVSNYSVDTLDKLVVRLVSEELAQLPQR